MTTWNDTDIPLAFLTTFRTYGTWLHGDKRGSIDRFHNVFREPRVAANPVLERQHRAKLVCEPVILDARQRPLVELAVREVCANRSWGLRAVNFRTNHVHVVVSTGDRNPDKALNAFKAYATRKLRESGYWMIDRSPWVDKGSERWLWNETSVWYGCDYVLNGQGGDLSEFDNWEMGNDCDSIYL
ncbi:MAG: transposase [Pyrinomonadaceae bacterium]